LFQKTSQRGFDASSDVRLEVDDQAGGRLERPHDGLGVGAVHRAVQHHVGRLAAGGCEQAQRDQQLE